MLHKVTLILCSLTIVFSCSPLKRSLDKKFEQTETRLQDYTGFMLYDLEKKESIYQFDADKYFTPASNTKIFTFYTSLRILSDSVPALRYDIKDDSLIIWGTGDPSLLYKFVYDNGAVFNFLKSSNRPLSLSITNFQTTPFGAGWAWDDYNDYYSAERSPLPLYGNIFSVIHSRSTMSIQPPFFTRYFTLAEDGEKSKVTRNQDNNEFKFYPSRGSEFKADIPIKVDPLLTIQLLTDTLKREVRLSKTLLTMNAKTFYSIPSDSLYRVMMQESDNFIAEQLLLICSGILSDTLQPEIAIKYAVKNFLNDLPDKPVWVDGSGLSRYNLFTPRSIVRLWEKIYEVVPRERLFSLLATGGESGTIKNWYKAEKPYIFGKTGSLSNNHCLSGYLVTRKGKTLIFSFMNSNFTVPGSEVRQNMQSILNFIYETY